MTELIVNDDREIALLRYIIDVFDRTDMIVHRGKFSISGYKVNSELGGIILAMNVVQDGIGGTLWITIDVYDKGNELIMEESSDIFDILTELKSILIEQALEMVVNGV